MPIEIHSEGDDALRLDLGAHGVADSPATHEAEPDATKLPAGDTASDPAATADELATLVETGKLEDLGKADFAGCEERIGHVFRDRKFLEAALTHASGAQHRLASNERLEFLGDAILGAVVCEILFHQYPEYLEGDLTKIKSVVVSRKTCAKVSESLGLEEFLILGKGMASDPKVPKSLLADVFESLLAAIYLDGGDAAAREFITRHMGPQIELAANSETGGNYKSMLQQEAQRRRGVTPTYQLLDEKGPDHSKCFMISAQVGGTRYAPAWGRSKKEAEQRAAHNAMSEIKGESIPYPTADSL